MPEDPDSDGSILGLGLTVADIKAEDSLRWIVRRLAQVTVELKRLADVQELQLKLGLVRQGLSFEALRSAEYEIPAVAAEGTPAMESLAQTPAEIAELEKVEAEYQERFGRPPLGLDLYAELAKAQADNPEEAP